MKAVLARSSRRKRTKSSARKVVAVSVPLLAVLILVGVWYALNGGPSPGTTTSNRTSTSVNSSHSSAPAQATVVTRTDKLSDESQDLTCTGLSTSQMATNAKVVSSGLKDAFYDTQYFFDLQGDQSSMSFNVQAVQKNDSFGYGPGLMVDGTTNKGYWFQVGVVYNWWKHAGKGHSLGFQMFYQVYNTQTGRAVYPYANGSTSPINFTTLHSGDSVTLSLRFQNDAGLMQAIVLRTGETITKSYPAYGATFFVSADPNSDYPTSLLTEWPHVVPFLCMNTVSQFTPTSGGFGSGWIQINIWNFTGYPISEWFNSGLPGQYILHTPPESFSLLSSTKLFYVNYQGLGTYVKNDGFVTM